VLIDKALNRGYVLSPLAAPHHRRDGLVFPGPSDKGKRSWPSPDGGRGKRSLTYERSSTRCAVSAQGMDRAGDVEMHEVRAEQDLAAHYH
jgi:hypothetical protein